MIQHLKVEAYIVPLFWGVRLVPHFTKVRGHISTPSIHINQDLAEVWLSE